MKIQDVQLFTVSGPYDGPEFPAGERQSQQLDIYPEFNARTGATSPLKGSPASATYVEVIGSDGVSGLFGPIQDFQAYPILRYLRPFLLGRDALATELLYDQMLRMDRHGRSGFFMTAVSAIDCAFVGLEGQGLAFACLPHFGWAHATRRSRLRIHVEL
jgi:L-rhamnonate dehydratase